MKNKAWFKKFESKNFDRIYYVEGNHVYYDLIALVDEPEHSKDTFKYLAIPAPIFAKEKMGEEITGKEINFGKEKRRDIEDYLSFDLDTTLQFYSRDEYYEMAEEEKIRQEGLELYDTLSDGEKTLIDRLWGEKLILDHTENQFGENIPERYITGCKESGFTIHTLSCHSSEWLGMGICQCNSHPTYKEEPISLAEVLEIVKGKMVEFA